MTAFDRAFEATAGRKGVEGGYSNRPSDGETWRGIARRHWSEWPGWRIVDRLRQRPGFPDALWEDAELDRLVKAFYLANFWAGLKCGEMVEPLAAEVFDTAVNTGRLAAATLLQVACVLEGQDIRIDGKIGEQTIDATHVVGADRILARWPDLQAGYYVRIVVSNPARFDSINGWIRQRARAA